MKTEQCPGIIDLNRNYHHSERVRGFQPPWYTVDILKCPECGRLIRMRRNWTGNPPFGAIRCTP